MARELAWVVTSGAVAVGLLGASLAVYGLPAAATTPAADEAQRLMLVKGCGTCHRIPGVIGATGEFAPDLAGVAVRTRIAGGAVPHAGPEDLQRWILDPPALKPGTAMPKLGLTPAEAATVAKYLESLR